MGRVKVKRGVRRKVQGIRTVLVSFDCFCLVPYALRLEPCPEGLLKARSSGLGFFAFSTNRREGLRLNKYECAIVSQTRTVEAFPGSLPNSPFVN